MLRTRCIHIHIRTRSVAPRCSIVVLTFVVVAGSGSSSSIVVVVGASSPSRCAAMVCAMHTREERVSTSRGPLAMNGERRRPVRQVIYVSRRCIGGGCGESFHGPHLSNTATSPLPTVAVLSPPTFVTQRFVAPIANAGRCTHATATRLASLKRARTRIQQHTV